MTYSPSLLCLAFLIYVFDANFFLSNDTAALHQTLGFFPSVALDVGSPWLRTSPASASFGGSLVDVDRQDVCPYPSTFLPPPSLCCPPFDPIATNFATVDLFAAPPLVMLSFDTLKDERLTPESLSPLPRPSIEVLPALAADRPFPSL